MRLNIINKQRKWRFNTKINSIYKHVPTIAVYALAAFMNGSHAVSPSVDSYFHNGLYSGAFHSQLCAAEASQAPVAGRKATVRIYAGPRG